MENNQLIDKAIGYIQNNPRENLSLADIAENAGFTLNYFDTIFRRHTGYTPVEYARIYRLTRSALDLRRTEKTVLDIALDFGYATPESFARAFRNFYGMTPSEYRERYADTAVTWHDLSGRIAISHFAHMHPELTVSDVDSALDFCFLHNPQKYAEDIIGMTVAETGIFTLAASGASGSWETLTHFLCVSDYNSAEPTVALVAETEADALLYLPSLTQNDNPRFSVRRSVGAAWDTFDTEAAAHGFACNRGYDMVYTDGAAEDPKESSLTVRALTADDLPKIAAFRQSGGCAECHLRAIRTFFDGKGNVGLHPVGVLDGDPLIGLALPILDSIRDLRKYDIGAVFTEDSPKKTQIAELLWKYVIRFCRAENAVLGNAHATEDDSPLGVAFSERMGLVRIAENCWYRR